MMNLARVILILFRVMCRCLNELYLCIISLTSLPEFYLGSLDIDAFSDLGIYVVYLLKK